MAIIVAQKVNLSNVRILKAFAPSINFGIGVVPPVQNISRNVKDKPIKIFRFVHTLKNM
jgi:hypothetical protein